uniref:Uncharacterized protein n=1 Tax=Steinernema glaseri TaxID=37863 RepID=A0A1I8A546_9BILA
MQLSNLAIDADYFIWKRTVSCWSTSTESLTIPGTGKQSDSSPWPRDIINGRRVAANGELEVSNKQRDYVVVVCLRRRRRSSEIEEATAKDRVITSTSVDRDSRGDGDKRRRRRTEFARIKKSGPKSNGHVHGEFLIVTLQGTPVATVMNDVVRVACARVIF